VNALDTTRIEETVEFAIGDIFNMIDDGEGREIIQEEDVNQILVRSVNDGLHVHTRILLSEQRVFEVPSGLCDSPIQSECGNKAFR
jgi:hypothetical protein